MRAPKSLVLTLSKTLITFGIIAFGTVGLATTDSHIASISSATTDGTDSDSVFQLSITSGQLANALTTESNIDLSVEITPQESHQGLKASVYAVIVAAGEFYKLEEDGTYAPWNGTVEDLTAFSTDQILASVNRFTLLDGKMSEAGNYLYFVAYGVENESRLLFTPDPAQLVVAESDAPLDTTSSLAAKTFEAELESAVV